MDAHQMSAAGETLAATETPTASLPHPMAVASRSSPAGVERDPTIAQVEPRRRIAAAAQHGEGPADAHPGVDGRCAGVACPDHEHEAGLAPVAIESERLVDGQRDLAPAAVAALPVA